MPTAAERAAIDAGPFFVRTPFTILYDQAEKTPWPFTEIRARSFIDPERRTYLPRVERCFLGIGRGDYSLDGFQDRVAIERKSMVDFQGTLLGWAFEVDKGEWTANVDRRARFKRELKTLETLDCKAIVVEASFAECLFNSPAWGVRSSEENSNYLHATALAWQQQFAVPWIFCDDRRLAEITAFRILEKWWAEEQKRAHPPRRKKKAES